MELVNLIILLTVTISVAIWIQKKLKKLKQMKVEIVDENTPMDSASLLHLAEEADEITYYSTVL
jgi:hypothetical protein